MNSYYYAFVLYAILFSLLGIDKIWFDFISDKFWVKIFWTLIVISGLTSIIYLLRKYWTEEESLKNNKYIN